MISLHACLFNYDSSQGESLTKEETRGLAVFLCHLCTNQSTLLPVLIKGTDHFYGKELSDVYAVRKLMNKVLNLKRN